MTDTQVTRTKNFDSAKFTYKPPRINKRGGKNIYVQYEGHNLYLQFPNIKTWGVNERVDEDTGRISYDLSLQWGTADESTKEGKFLKVLKTIEDKVLDDASAHSKEWFGKSKMSRDVAENLMYPILKYPKDKKTGELDHDRFPTVKAKLPYWDNKFNLELYDMDKKPLFGGGVDTTETPLSLVPSGSFLKGIIECAGVWFVGGRFGVSWRLIQAQVRQPVRIKGFCMVSDSEDDDEGVSQVAAAAVMMESSDSEDNDEPPQPKKKPVRRKKKVVKASS